MQKSKAIFFALFLLQATWLSAQGDSSSAKIKISDLNIMTGVTRYDNQQNSISDLLPLLKNSSLNAGIPAGFQYSSNTEFTPTASFSILLGLKFRDHSGAAKPNYRLRVGATYYSGAGSSIYASRSETGRKDTLYGSGTVLYLDTTRYESYSAAYKFSQLRLDASFLFSTNTEKRWSFYSGLGLSIGASLNARTNITHSIYESFSLTDNQSQEYTSYSGGSSNYLYDKESVKNKTNFGMTAYLPFGVDLRVGKKNVFFKHIHFFGEARTLVNLTSIPETGNFTNAGYQLLAGLRIEIP